MDNNRNVGGVVFLGIIILIFVIGGYFLMNYMTKDNNDKEKMEEINDLRINTSKDYIYFENTEEIEDEIYKEDIVLNFIGLEDLNSNLHNELEELSKNQVLYTDQEVPEGIICSLYSFSYREYVKTEYKDLVSVVIHDYDYTCGTSAVPKKTKSYVIDITTGKILSDEEILSKFEISEDLINSSVKKRLDDTQVLDEEEQVIDIEGTLENLKNTEYGEEKALSISKNGKLVINFLVKSNKINYNDSIELN